MKTARIRYNNEVLDVQVNDELQVTLPSGEVLEEKEVEWLPPANGTMFALGLNYADHARELAFEPPKEPLIFIKAPNLDKLPVGVLTLAPFKLEDSSQISISKSILQLL